jgi:PAS domain S-box-containing protein
MTWSGKKMAGMLDPADIGTDLEFHRQIVESTHDCVKMLDLEGRLVYLTPKAQELLGICDLDGFLNRPWIDLWQEPWKAMAAAAVEAAKAGERGAFQGFCPTLDGTPKWWDVVVTPIAGPGGNASALLAISRDVTRQKEADDALRAAQSRISEIGNQLGHVARLTMLGTLTASIAHQLTQPLTAIMTNAQAARRLATQPVPDIGQLTAALDDIVRDDQRAGDIIEHFRALLRRGGPAKELCDLNATIQESVGMVRAEAAERRIVLDCQFDDAPLIWADRVQLQQLVLNLLMNAVEAVAESSPATRQVTVRTRLDRQRSVQVCVENEGARVTADQVDRMREPFYTTKPEGLGLGLAICREILRAHRSELRAECRRAGGLTFSFVLRTTTRASARKRSGLVAGHKIGTRVFPPRLSASRLKRSEPRA